MKRLSYHPSGCVVTLDYTGEAPTWDVKERAPLVPQGSRRYTSSSRHPGRSIQGTPTKLADAGLPEDLGLCVCGCRREGHPRITRHAFTQRSNHG